MNGSRRVAVIAALLAASGSLVAACAESGQELESVDPGDPEVLGPWVQPLLRNSCASLDCHGDPGRPLRIYALHGLRIDAALRGEEESLEELQANALALASVDPLVATAEDNLVVRKPLAKSAGGYEHVGGDLFESADAPGYVCLLAWLRGELPGVESAEQACAAAAALAAPGPAGPGGESGP